MIHQDHIVPPDECVWHPINLVAASGPVSQEMIAMVTGLTNMRELNGAQGHIIGPGEKKTGKILRWKFVLDNPEVLNGRYPTALKSCLETSR